MVTPSLDEACLGPRFRTWEDLLRERARRLYADLYGAPTGELLHVPYPDPMIDLDDGEQIAVGGRPARVVRFDPFLGILEVKYGDP